MGEIDLSFRTLIRQRPRPLLQLAFPGHHIEPLGALDPSVDRPRARTTDNFFRVRCDNTDATVHIEIEREWRSTMQKRLFDYASSATTATRLPVSSILLLLRPGGDPPIGTGEYRIPGVVGDTFIFHYHVIPLWRLDAHQMRNELGLDAAPFIVAMRGADDVFIRTLALQALNDVDAPTDHSRGTYDLIYTVAAAIFGADATRRILHVESITQHPAVLELHRERTADAEAKGQAKGEAKGEAKGRRESLYAVLSQRSFNITPAMRAQIDGEQDSVRLGSWLNAALTAATSDDVFRL